MRFLYRLFFLERFPWLSRYVRPPESRPATQVKILYKTELEILIHFLQGQLQERVYYSVSVDGRAIIGTVSETIAEISLHPKGERKRLAYIAVRLEDGYEMHQAWFQLAFVSHVVRFRKPILTLHKSWNIPSRGH